MKYYTVRPGLVEFRGRFAFGSIEKKSAGWIVSMRRSGASLDAAPMVCAPRATLKEAKALVG